MAVTAKKIDLRANKKAARQQGGFLFNKGE
jgi:hypothetical protein